MSQFPAPHSVPIGIPRCPACGALTPASASGSPAQWCSLCLVRLPSEVHGNHQPPSDNLLSQDLSALPLPTDAPLPAPSVALDGEYVDQMLTALKQQDDDPWVARSKRFSSRGQRVGLAIAIGVGVVVLVMIASFVVGRFL